MTIKLDSFDRRILYELDVNARITTSDIARMLRKSKQFVDYRIRRLEAEKVISGYMTVIDYSRLGYTSIRVYFTFHNITPEEQKALEDDLIKDKEVWWLVTVEGPWHVGYAMAVKNILDFYDYWDKIMKRYRKFIAKRMIVPYTHIRQYPKSYIIGRKNDKPGTLVGASKMIAKIADLDIRLLKLISDKGRMPLIDIATRLKTSPQVIRSHLKKLEKAGVVQGYRALIDVSHLGYRYYKSYINLIHTDRIRELEGFCRQHPNILNINRTIGGKDYEIELQARDFEQFESIMNEIRTGFAGMIDDYEFVIAIEEKKMTYFPFDQ